MLHGNLRRHSLAGITSLPTCFPGAAELFGDSVYEKGSDYFWSRYFFSPTI